MSKDQSDEELLASLGVDITLVKKVERSAREQRIIAGFEEIVRFAKEHGKQPRHGEGLDIFERIYATRLDAIRNSAECRKVLEGVEGEALLEYKEAGSSLREDGNDEELLTALGVDWERQAELTKLKYVKPRAEIRAAEEVAKRDICKDFDVFRPLFESVQKEIESGMRRTIKYKDNAEVNKGDLFILDGQKIYVAEVGELFVNDYERPDRRLRVIYENGTENDMLLRSLQRGLNKDKTSRRITEPSLGPLFSDEEEDDDLAAGYIYILRSLSEEPFIAANRSVIHKIGVTGGDVKKRIANAKKDATYLLADVEIVQTFRLANINRKKLETLLHQFLAPARLDMELKDRFGYGVEPKEWFLAPLPVIQEVVEKLMDGTIGDFRYDAETAQIVKR
jgi:T5orf172 domain